MSNFPLADLDRWRGETERSTASILLAGEDRGVEAIGSGRYSFGGCDKDPFGLWHYQEDRMHGTVREPQGTPALYASLHADNNHIRIIEGLATNIKLNVLSLAYNRIEKVANLAHLKELKRLCLGDPIFIQNVTDWARAVPNISRSTNGKTCNPSPYPVSFLPLSP